MYTSERADNMILKFQVVIGFEYDTLLRFHVLFIFRAQNFYDTGNVLSLKNK